MTKRRKEGPRDDKRAAELLATGLQLHQAGRLEAARARYRAVLKLDPRSVNALHLLGLAEYHSGEAKEGMEHLAEAVRLDGGNVRAMNDLGNMHHETGDLAEAERLFRQILQLDPQHSDAHNSLGVCLKDAGHLGPAMDEYRRAIALQPRRAGYHRNLGHALKLGKEWAGAEEAFREAVTHAPEDQDAWRNLGIVLRHQDRLEEAREAFQRLLDFDPENAVARHLVAACDSAQSPDRAESGYVREVFDEFAESFESHLDQLRYDAPEWIGRVVENHYPGAARSLAILDAGCGTGLCGPILNPFAVNLVGIDLSPKMLEKAALKDSYHELVTGDLLPWLHQHENEFDVIAAADTFNYFGDLDPVFEACAATLRAPGLLLFTLEHAGGEIDAPYKLFPHGRFGHRREYVADLLGKHHLAMAEEEERTLRLEAGTPVPGLFIAARKHGA